MVPEKGKLSKERTEKVLEGGRGWGVGGGGRQSKTERPTPIDGGSWIFKQDSLSGIICLTKNLVQGGVEWGTVDNSFVPYIIYYQYFLCPIYYILSILSLSHILYGTKKVLTVPRSPTPPLFMAVA